MGFAGTTLVLSLFNVNAAGVAAPNVVVGMAIFFGGLAQLLAGMWEFACGNTFGATAFTGYGAFWLSYSAILIPGTGIISSYAGNEAELGNALGIYLFSWFIFTFLLLYVMVAPRPHATGAYTTFLALLPFVAISASFSSSLSSRSRLPCSALVSILGLPFQLTSLTVCLPAELSASTTLKHAGGAFGLITAFIAYYCAMAELLRPDDSWFTLPLGQIRRRVD
jgi:succinate-acetate transporter protein